jgi:hypothetical protein
MPAVLSLFVAAMAIGFNLHGSRDSRHLINQETPNNLNANNRNVVGSPR